MSNIFSHIADSICDILQNDYAGYKENVSMSALEQYQVHVLSLGETDSDKQIFIQLTKSLLRGMFDKHLQFFSQGRTKAIGFDVRRYLDTLYVSNITSSSVEGLSVGDMITAVNGIPINECTKYVWNSSKTASYDGEEWQLYLHNSETCTAHDNEGNIREYQITKHEIHYTQSEYVSREIDKNIFYLRFDDFNDTVQAEHVYKHYNSIAEKYPYLIVDVRNNAGGFDTAWVHFVELLFPESYTINVDNHKHLITAQNIKNRVAILEKALLNNPNDAMLEKFLTQTEQMSITNDWAYLYPVSNPYAVNGTSIPRKVVILIDKYCGSSGESFVMIARQSPKVKLIGRNTAGCLDYSNVTYEHFADIGYTLQYATSKSDSVERGCGIDGKGIAPDILLPWNPDMLERDIDLETAVSYIEHGIV